MVVRKPLPPNASVNAGLLSSDPSSSLHERSPQHDYQYPQELDSNYAKEWRSEALEQDVPPSLRPAGGRRSMEGSQRGSQEIPESLRAGTPGRSPRSSGELQRLTPESTNPYIRRQQTGQSTSSTEGGESSAGAWSDNTQRPPQPLSAPPPPPIFKDDAPAEKLAALSIAEPSSNPWRPPLDSKPLPQYPSSMQRQDSGNEAWSEAPEARLQEPVGTKPPVLVTMSTEESPAWDEDEPPSRTNLTPSSDPEVVPTGQEEQNAWGGESNLPAQDSGVVQNSPLALGRHPSEGQAPTLPPRRSHEDPPSMPPRPVGDSEESTSSTPGAAARRQKKETYEIKKVSWYDATAASNPRISPILVQNANGPCPLLALVNALTLSTPANVNTALVETLRSREQVSLGLLLDAVFDELMSGRRGDAAQELPDVGDLYAFLVTLHTGMNVNPRFFPRAAIYSDGDPRNSISHVHPTEREGAIPGTFEETREMKLYSTFSVPLIHGWLPPKNSPAYEALRRSARTYEDAQNLMFREEELEDKLQREGLSFEEQSTLEDISTIKAFFKESATQLTPYGLETITKSMSPGSVAILFRNDHFSTLYRHPESHQLLHLVTDMGYAGHEEIVWESLVDVNGENCEFFSGDFRIVGNAVPESPRGADDSGWTTVSRRGTQGQSANTSQHQNPTATQGSGLSEATPTVSNTEQEDHDLALALQLQDEEEQRHQAEQARRRRETELSQQYIEQQGTQAPLTNQIPVTTRGGGRARGRNPSRGSADMRPAIPPRRSNVTIPPPVSDPEAGVDAPPPSYEQAATQPSYIPPVNHPAHPSARVDGPNMTRRSSAYSATSAAFSPPVEPMPGRMGRVGRVNSLISDAQNMRRQQQMVAQQRQEERDRDCVVM